MRSSVQRLLDRAKLTDALASSTFAGHVMPYGPTKFVNGQNEGAAPVNTQVLDNDIKVILPATFANAKAVFPRTGVSVIEWRVEFHLKLHPFP